MNYLMIAQYMAAAALFAIAMTHLLIWVRSHKEIIHLIFALTAVSAGANALAEENMYRADSIEDMCTALRWYVATSGCWAVATVCFFAAYSRVSRFGWYLTIAIVFTFVVAIIINLFSPASYLFVEVTSLREITLPWGERIQLAVGKDNPLRLMTELAMLAIFGVAADGYFRFWQRNQRTRALFFGASVFAFMAFFFVHAYLVDTGRLDSPYLSTYGFLALVLLMSYELADEILRMSKLSSELKLKEFELRSAVADERNRIAGELHDSVTQTLFSTAAIADALPEVWRRDRDKAMRGLDDLKLLTKGALAEMRSLLVELRPAALSEKNLGQLLQQLASATVGRTRIPVELEIEGNARFPEEVKVALYRVAQESLNNVIKHADATQVWMHLGGHANDALLTIRDNGCGYEKNRKSPPGMGLEIMRERMQSIGGRLELDSQTQTGTTVSAVWTRGADQRADNER